MASLHTSYDIPFLVPSATTVRTLLLSLNDLTRARLRAALRVFEHTAASVPAAKDLDEAVLEIVDPKQQQVNGHGGPRLGCENCVASAAHAHGVR